METKTLYAHVAAPYFDIDPAAETEEALAERQTYLATLEPDICHVIYKLALTDWRSLRSFLRTQSTARLSVLSFWFAAWLQVEHGVSRTPGLLLRNWTALITPDPWE